MFRRAARLIPPTIATGVARISGQGRCDDEDRQRAKPVVCDQHRDRANQQRDRREPYGVLVGESLKRRLAALRRAHELDDAGVLALGRECGGANAERPEPVGCPAHDRSAGTRHDGDGFAGEGRRVDLRLTGQNLAVAWHELTGADEQFVTDLDLFDGNVSHAIAGDTVADSRSRFLERAHGGRRPPLGVPLQRLPARLHEDDDESGQRLVEQD
jgi:hypothetical protein